MACTAVDERIMNFEGNDRHFITQGNVDNEDYRMMTFQTCHAISFPLRAKLARAGFYYSEDIGVTICNRCKILIALTEWQPHDNPHNQKFHENGCDNLKCVDDKTCRFTETTKLSTVAEPKSIIRKVLDEYLTEKISSVYPCKSPQNPHMAKHQMRVGTFDFRWQGGGLKATKEDIAKAGFYYLGDSDRTKCWYCNGGLQNWEPNDDPMYEHAKWFPGCEFVLKTLGPRRVKEITEAIGNVARPMIKNQVHYQHGMEKLQALEKDNNILEKFFNGHSTVENTKRMGFCEEYIAKAIVRRWDNIHTLYRNSEEMVNDILDSSTPPTDENNKEFLPTISVTTAGVKLVTPPEPQIHSIPSANDQGVDFLCKICFKAQANMANMPCGHMTECENCTTDFCSICHIKVEDKFKVYLS